MATSLYEYYTQSGKALPPLSQRFNDPAFAAAAAAAGVTREAYTAAGSNNANFNNKILAALEKGGSGGLSSTMGQAPSGGGSVNPGGVAQASGPDKTGLPSAPSSGIDTPLPNNQAQQGNIGTFSSALRLALNEAGAERIKGRANAMSTGGFQPKTPGTLGAVSELLRNGIETPIESVYSDTIDLFKQKMKEVELNPDQFRNVQGGIYDLKNNKWIVAPEPKEVTASGAKGKALTRTDIEKLGLPVSLVGTTWGAFLEMVDSQIAPEWFAQLAKKEVQNQKKMSMLPAALNKEVQALWDSFRAQFTSSFDITGSGGGSDFDINDL